MTGALFIAYAALAYWCFWGTLKRCGGESVGTTILNVSLALLIGPALIGVAYLAAGLVELDHDRQARRTSAPPSKPLARVL